MRRTETELIKTLAF